METTLAGLKKEGKTVKKKKIKAAPKTKNRPVPIDRQAPFNIDELFFSVTCPKSVITFANETFIRISGYSEKELMGELHKIIRHPDIPRTIFKVFWDYLLQNKPVAAYVKNLAKDGSYYWVMALAFPCKSGYLSVRLKPESSNFSKVADLYENLLKFEKEQEALTDKRKALETTENYLLKILNEMGFSSYDEFMWYSLEKEMHNREEALQKHKLSKKADHTPEHYQHLQSALVTLFEKTEALNRMHTILIEHSDYLLKLARSILLLSVNAQVGSAKLGQKHIFLSVVAEKLGEQSFSGEKKLVQMQEIVTNLNNLLKRLNFNIISSKLQVEMNIDFMEELAENKKLNSHSVISADDAIEMLKDGFMPKIIDIKNQIGELPQHLRKLRTGVYEIGKFLQTLRFIHVTGKIEVARLDDHNSSFATTFNELIQQIEYAEEKMVELAEFIEGNEEIGKIFAGNKLLLEDFLFEADRQK